MKRQTTDEKELLATCINIYNWKWIGVKYIKLLVNKYEWTNSDEKWAKDLSKYLIKEETLTVNKN